MFVVTVEFSIKPECIETFMVEMLQNARTSLETELGCHRFDVCQGEHDRSKVFLYEVYLDKNAFETHLASAHFLIFDKTVAPMVNLKIVGSWTLGS